MPSRVSRIRWGWLLWRALHRDGKDQSNWKRARHCKLVLSINKMLIVQFSQCWAMIVRYHHSQNSNVTVPKKPKYSPANVLYAQLIVTTSFVSTTISIHAISYVTTQMELFHYTMATVIFLSSTHIPAVVIKTNHSKDSDVKSFPFIQLYDSFICNLSSF